MCNIFYFFGRMSDIVALATRYHESPIFDAQIFRSPCFRPSTKASVGFFLFLTLFFSHLFFFDDVLFLF